MAQAKKAGGAKMATGMTNHARVRCRQRGVPPLVVDWLLQYGEEQYDCRGAVTRYFDKKAKNIIEKKVGKHTFRHFDAYMNCYLVESVLDGGVITVGYRTKHIKKG